MLIHFGFNEYALRFLPFVAGVVSLWLFYRLITHVATRPAVISVALGLFVLSDNLIYYGSEIRPGSLDVMCALLIALLVIKRPWEYRHPLYRIVLVGIVGGLTLWVSHPALFGLVGAGIYEGLVAIRKKEAKPLAIWMGISALWALSFVLNYWLSLRFFAKFQGIHSAFAMNFMPFPPKTLFEAMWLPMSLFRHVAYFAGLRLTLLNVQTFNFLTMPVAEMGRVIAINGPLFIGIFGVIGAYFSMLLMGLHRLYQNDKRVLCILGVPFGIAIVASCLGHYPFVGRFFLFTFPFLITVTAEAVVYFYARYNTQWWSKILLGAIFILPIGSSLFHVWRPRSLETVKSGFVYLMARAGASDVMLYTADTNYTAEFYRQKYDFHRIKYVAPSDLAQVVGSMKGERVWVLSGTPQTLSGQRVYQNQGTQVILIE